MVGESNKRCMQLMNKILSRVFLVCSCLVLLSSCTGLPKGIIPVEQFELDIYLGKWFEIARLDHRFERGLSNVSAVYSLNGDGDVVVMNRGYDQKKQEWKEAIGKARFKGNVNTGHLTVSFFGPFFGSYVIFELDEVDYQYAFVSGYNRKSLWFLSRSATVSDELYNLFVSRADELGFETAGLIRVDQSLNNQPVK